MLSAMTKLLLNIDAGELEGEPEELYALADVVNIACGGHAGDDATIARAVSSALRHGARVGAHPSYADREGFGRRAQSVAPAALRALVAEQCERLLSHADRAGAKALFVKPHGALYHAADRDSALAEAVLGGAVEALGYEIACIGPAGGALSSAAEACGVGFLREGFANRGVGPDGKLIPRGQPGALVDNPAVAGVRAAELARGATVDTVCTHGDGPNALAIARAVRAALGPRRA